MTEGTASACDVGLYVYGVTLRDVPTAIETVATGALKALVSEEPLTQYRGDALEAAVGRPGWLEEKVLAHEAVLEAARRGGPVAPFRFGTIFPGPAELTAALEQAEAQLLEQLEQLSGAAEWGVKAWVEESVVHEWLRHHDTEVADLMRRTETAESAGRRYLVEKQLGRCLRRVGNDLLSRQAVAAHDALAGRARDARAEPLLPRDPDGAKRLFLRASYLVPDETMPVFEGCLEELRIADAPLGITYALSGPWAAYSFVNVTLEAG